MDIGNVQQIGLPTEIGGKGNQHSDKQRIRQDDALEALRPVMRQPRLLIRLMDAVARQKQKGRHTYRTRQIDIARHSVPSQQHMKDSYQ